MTLPFQTKWPERMVGLAGQPNYFIHAIWMGLLEQKNADKGIVDEYLKYRELYRDKFRKNWDVSEGQLINGGIPKLHTLRHDPHDRWEPGMKIHFVINNRTKDYFQFAQIIEVKAVQKIEIMAYETDVRTGAYYTTFLDNYRYKVHQVKIDNRPILIKECYSLALNDGFPSVEAFFQYFNEDFKGKIIHWTDLRY